MIDRISVGESVFPDLARRDDTNLARGRLMIDGEGKEN
jgi:hypothetical protein